MAELRVPPGRAGRMWLAARLATAHRAATLLDHELRVLRAERERCGEVAGRTGPAWAAAGREADRWLTRAAVLGGQREIRLGAADRPAEVSVSWETLMGVRYPRTAACVLPEESAEARSAGTAALSEATAAHRRALRAAAEHAAAVAAGRILDGEIRQTRRRLHAIDDRRIPRLESALRTLTERLDEAERAEAVQLRWAAGRAGPAEAR